MAQNKEQQTKLLIEMMEADAKDGMYDRQTDHIGDSNKMVTAVKYLFDQLWETAKDKFTWYSILKHAKEMEKDQIVRSFIEGQNTQINNPMLPHYSGEEYYNETYTKQ